MLTLSMPTFHTWNLSPSTPWLLSLQLFREVTATTTLKINRLPHPLSHYHNQVLRVPYLAITFPCPKYFTFFSSFTLSISRDFIHPNISLSISHTIHLFVTMTNNFVAISISQNSSFDLGSTSFLENHIGSTSQCSHHPPPPRDATNQSQEDLLLDPHLLRSHVAGHQAPRTSARSFPSPWPNSVSHFWGSWLLMWT